MPESSRPGAGLPILLTGIAVAAFNLLLAAIIVRMVGTTTPELPQGALGLVAVLGTVCAGSAVWQWRRYVDARRGDGRGVSSDRS